MLPKEYRLKKKNDFQRVYKEGRFFSLGEVVVNFINNSEKKSRFGFIVGKSYSKNAVERNRARRILRISISKMLSEIESKKDFVLSLRRSKSKINSSDMYLLLNKAFEKNKLLKK